MSMEEKKYLVIAVSVFLFLSLALFLYFKLFLFNQISQEPIIGPISKTATTTSGSVRREISEPNVKIKRYILGAEVTAVNGVEVSVTLQRLFEGDNGNYLDVDNKVVKISSSTEIVMSKIVNKKYSEVPATLADIKVGKKLTFYSAQNIKLMQVFSPYKVIISQ